ncbi:MAG: M3 family metallopeptidase [Elusimicrobiota bacterium]
MTIAAANLFIFLRLGASCSWAQTALSLPASLAQSPPAVQAVVGAAFQPASLSKDLSRPAVLSDEFKAELPYQDLNREIPAVESEPESEQAETSEALASRLVRSAGASEPFVSQVRALYAALLPAALLKDMADHGYVILVKHNVTQDRPDLTPDYDFVGGLHEWGSKGDFITIAENIRDRATDLWTPSLFWQNAACHEMGHAIARFLDATERKDFLDAWTADRDAMPDALFNAALPDGTKNKFTYFLYKNVDGSFRIAKNETFAEGFDILLRGKGSSYNYENFTKYFGRTLAAMRAILRERYNVQAFAELSSPPGIGEEAKAPIDFSLSIHDMVRTYKAAERRYIEEARAVLAVAEQERTFDNTVRALETARAEFNETAWTFNFLRAVSPDPRVRRMAGAISLRANRNLVDREDRLRVYQEYARKGETLEGEDKKILEKQLKDLGAVDALGPLERVRYDSILGSLAKLRQDYLNNLAAAEVSVEAEPRLLEGLSESELKNLGRTPDGKILVDASIPLSKIEDAGLRRELFLKRSDGGASKNVPILEESIRLRGELAGLFGRENYAQYRIVENMAGSEAKVREFLERLKDMLQGPAQAEQAALLELKRKDDPAARGLEPWDREYYSEKLKKLEYSVDSEEVRKYFPVDTVVREALSVFEDLLGLRFIETQAQAWHKDVRLFEVQDRSTGERLAWFYLDLFKRSGKEDFASHWAIRNGRELPEGGRREPVGALAANWIKNADGTPVLLSHHGVELFLHEFGHLLHHALARTRYASNAAAGVAVDFVEVPSKLMENLAWQPEILERISGRWDDPSKKIPKELLQSLMRARDFNAASAALFQVAFALTDLEYFSLPSPVDTTAVIEKVFHDCGLPSPGPRRQANFSHLVNQYGAGYYGYLWAQMLAQDIFSRFIKEGRFDPTAGPELRRDILERGSAADEAGQVRDFLGREPSEESFIRSLGLPAAGT